MHRRFFLVLFSVVLFTALCTGSSMAAGFPDGYLAARQNLEKMEKSGAHPAQWSELAADFKKIYDKNPSWKLRAAALYRSGAAMEGRARVTKAPKDARSAIELYDQVAVAHPSAALADDALYHAAVLSNEMLGDRKKSSEYLALIQKKYPKSDHAAGAASYLALLNKDAPKKETAQKKTAQAVASKAQAEKTVRDKAQHPSDSAKAQAAGKPASSLPDKESRAQPTTPQKQGAATQKEKPAAKTLQDKPAKQEQPSAGKKQDAISVSGSDSKAKIKHGEKAAPDAATNVKPGSARVQGKTAGSEDGGKKTAKSASAARQTESAKTAKPVPASGVKPAAEKKQDAQAGKKPVQAKAPASEKKPPEKSSSQSKARADARQTLAAQLGLSVRTIVLDAGHGGKDPGTMHNGVVEKSVNLNVALKLKTILEKHGFAVKMTRSSDKWHSLGERVRFGRRAQGDLFVSIHVNACDNPKISGMETYILDFARTSAASRLAMVENADSGRLGDMDRILTEILRGARTKESLRLAESIQRETTGYLKRHGAATRSGGVKGAPFFVLVGSSMPSVLVEIGYCTNAEEAERLKSDKHCQLMAEGLSIGIRAYAASLSGKK
ncbi:MAG: N-acetylmuramoyl-L-alanine amidase [Mailhella sp.]|nr:N-acetylmuramoyl-L-alanine amidase [Mailhella sp.]